MQVAIFKYREKQFFVEISMKALIVDDNLESRMLLGKILTKEFNAQIIEAVDGKEALKKLSREKPDVIFLDYEMPDMNGKEVLKSIRAIREFHNLPIVMVTAHSEKHIVRELLSYKVSSYLLKPLSKEYIVKKLSILFPNDRIGTSV
jgi:two-component system chemotaxis response regulator CheY